MRDETIPVLLEFMNVAADSSISINITTPGVSWSLGSRFGDTLGLSYNVVLDDAVAAESCIQRMMFNDNLLSIRTSPDAPALSTFTISLFLRKDLLTDSLMGYCTLNDEGTVLVSFGNERPVVWRNGRISAVLRPSAVRFRQVLFAVRGARPGNRIDIDLAIRPDLGDANWTLGPAFSETQGVQFKSSGDGLPISSLSYSRRQIRLRTRATGDGAPRDLAIFAYVSWVPEPLQFIYLKANCSENVEVYAQVGNRQPQYLSPTFTVFTL